MSDWEKVQVCDECSYVTKYRNHICSNCGDIKYVNLLGVVFGYTTKAGRKVSDRKWYNPRTWGAYHYEAKD